MKYLTCEDGYVAYDLLQYGVDHIKAGEHLFGSHPSFLDSGAYLIALGYECVLKGVLLHENKKFPKTHKLNIIVDHLSDDINPLKNNHKKAIDILSKYGEVRYPNRNEPASVGQHELALLKNLMTFTESKIPENISPEKLPDWLDESCEVKGGRILMRKSKI